MCSSHTHTVRAIKEKRYHSPLTHPRVVTKITSARFYSYVSLSINIYTIMYRVLYNEMDETRRIEIKSPGVKQKDK